MSRINRLPVGLLEFLQNPTQGDNPSVLEGSVRPTLDLAEFYKTYKLEVLTTQLTASGNVSMEIDVPDGEVWIVRGVHYTFQSATANNQVRADLRINNTSAGFTGVDNGWIFAHIFSDQLAVNEAETLPYEFNYPLALASASQIQLATRRVIGTGNNIHRLVAAFYRYQI